MTLLRTYDTRTQLLAFWKAEDLAAYQRVSAAHPLDFYAGHSPTRAWELLLVSSFEPQGMRHSGAVSVDTRKRHDGTWAIVVTLVSSDEKDVFVQLCVDLIDSSVDQPSSAQGIRFVVRRFRKWQRLLEQGHSGLLPVTAVKGLLGELLWLERFSLQRYTPITAVEGWQGPAAADRDFVYDAAWYEVKTIVSGSNEVTISSIEQLDVDRNGEMVVISLDRAPATDALHINLPRVISSVESHLADPFSLDLFRDKLLEAGYMDRPEYADMCFTVGLVRRYRIDQEFPRLRRRLIPAEVTEGSYKLSLNSLSSWLIEDERV